MNKDELIKQFTLALESISSTIETYQVDARILSSKNAEASVTYIESVSKSEELMKIAFDKINEANRVLVEAKTQSLEIENSVEQKRIELNSLNEGLIFLKLKIDEATINATIVDELNSTIYQLNKSKELILLELNKINNDLGNTKIAIDEANNVLKKSKEQVDNMLSNERKVLSDENIRLEKLTQELTSRELAAYEREQAVGKREESVRTIVARYESLYAEKGKSFRV